MQTLRMMLLIPAAILTYSGVRQPSAGAPQADSIVALERRALDRWRKGDPNGYLETYAPEITYFDPMQERRIDGIAAMPAPPENGR